MTPAVVPLTAPEVRKMLLRLVWRRVARAERVLAWRNGGDDTCTGPGPATIANAGPGPQTIKYGCRTKTGNRILVRCLVEGGKPVVLTEGKLQQFEAIA